MKTKSILGVLVSGRGSNLQSIIDSIDSGQIAAEIGIVLSDNKGALALERADKAGIPTMFIDPGEFYDKKLYEQKLIDVLEESAVNLVILAGFMRLLSSHFIRYYQNQIMNIHPSLLPSFPGLDAQQQALKAGVKVSGCTVHFVNEGIDTGPIILQEAVPVKDNDTVDSLASRILEREHVIYPRAISLYCEGKLIIKDNRVRIIGK